MKFFTLVLTVICSFQVFVATSNSNEIKNIFLVLDNSGSMKQHDPKFLMKKTVVDFIKSQDEQTSIGIVTFDTNAKVLIELTPLNSDENRNKCIQSLDKINYKGAFTNITAAVEIATYVLSKKENDSTFKAIVLVTDGYIDTGDKNLDIQKRNLLIETQSKAAKEAGIKIFGVAFTENADFELLQAISTNTDGNYFRAFKSEDLNAIFNELNERIIEKPVEIVKTVEIQKEPKFKSEYIFGLIFIIIVLSLSIYILIRRNKRGKRKYDPGVLIPPAFLVDENKNFNIKEFQIEKEVTSIGRVDENDVHLKKDDKTVTSFNHAQIVYRDNKFYLKDNSTNFTKLNGVKLEKGREYELNDRDEIKIVKYSLTFKFDEKYNNSTEFFNSDETVIISGDPEALIEPEISREDSLSGEQKSIDESEPQVDPEPKEETPADDERPAVPDPELKVEKPADDEQPAVPDHEPKEEAPADDEQQVDTSSKPEEETPEEDEQPAIPEPEPMEETPVDDKQQVDTSSKPKEETPVDDEQSPVPDPANTSDISATHVQIKCPNHPDKQAVEVCIDCFKTFCPDCISETEDGDIICVDCKAKKN